MLLLFSIWGYNIWEPAKSQWTQREGWDSETLEAKLSKATELFKGTVAALISQQDVLKEMALLDILGKREHS